MTEQPIRVAILGSTGSIGRQALDVIAANPELLKVVGLVAGRDEEALREQADRFEVERVGLGTEAAVEMASEPDVDVILNAVVGAAGLEASIAALGSGKRLALANKESLVAGGEVCLAAARAGGGSFVPVDSEHAALAQCLEGVARDSIERVVLTASGGPFRDRDDLTGVTRAEALAHPTWSMGPKITVDSATLMNKGFEVIEAHFLFGFSYDEVDVIVHPQSRVHCIVELFDGSMLMQAGPPDMRIPIQAALTAPERRPATWDRLDLVETAQLTFEEVDHERFPAVRLACEAGRKGATYPAALNAANEVAVGAFLEGKMGFGDIVDVVESVLSEHDPKEASELSNVLEVDGWAREEAARSVSTRAAPSTTERGVLTKR